MSERAREQAEPTETSQEKADKEAEQGYIGTTPDTTPNEAYTVEGVTSGAETPETRPAEEEAPAGGADAAVRQPELPSEPERRPDTPEPPSRARGVR
jgi:hypothetical protein